MPDADKEIVEMPLKSIEESEITPKFVLEFGLTKYTEPAEPGFKYKLPPVDAPFPAFKLIELPVATEESPTEKETAPACPELAAPVAKLKSPVFPDEESPVDKDIDPLAPAVETDPLSILTAPESPDNVVPD